MIKGRQKFKTKLTFKNNYKIFAERKEKYFAKAVLVPTELKKWNKNKLPLQLYLFIYN